MRNERMEWIFNKEILKTLFLHRKLTYSENLMSIIITLVAADKRRLERQILCVAAQKQKALLNSKAREREKNPSLDRNFKEINIFDATKRDLQKFKKLLSKNILHVRFTSTMKSRTENLWNLKLAHERE